MAYTSYNSSLRPPSGVTIFPPRQETLEFNFLGFLATAQALDVEFLPISWDAGRSDFGRGGTSRITETVVNEHISFAFKRVNRSDSETQIFETLVNEINVLSHPLIREGAIANVVQLQGICWEVSSDGKPWPVLVFEKSHLGDMVQFMLVEEGKSTNLKQRLKLCLDIGEVITQMHHNGIIHGDIKPNNVLVFKDKDGTYAAQVADFGYSALYADDDFMIKLPISLPWNPPEHNRASRYWHPLDAQRVDIYSMALLFLWLMFEKYFSGVTSLPQQDCETITMHVFSPERLQQASTIDLLIEVKELKEDLPLLIAGLLKTVSGLTSDEKLFLEKFLASGLSHTPAERDGALEEFLSAFRMTELSPQDLKRPMYCGRPSDFKIESSLEALYRCYYRIRSYIFECLMQSCQKDISVSAQLARCYYIGFGTPRDEAKLSNIVQVLNIEVQDIYKALFSSSDLENVDESKPNRINQIIGAGQLLWHPISESYVKDQKLSEAESCILREINDLSKVVGEEHDLVCFLKTSVSEIYDLQGRWKDAERLDEEVLKARKKRLGDNHPDTLTTMADLALTYRYRGRLKDAEALELSLVQMGTEILGDEHLDTLTGIGNLAGTYAEQGRFNEAEELFLKVMETTRRVFGEEHLDTAIRMADVAWVARLQGRFDEAEALHCQVFETRKRILGEEHPDTLLSMDSLTKIYGDQGRLGEAENMLQTLIEIKERVLGEEHPRTLSSASALAMTLLDQDKAHEAEEKLQHIIAISNNVMGQQHRNTLDSMHRLVQVYMKQRRGDKAELLCREVLETRRQIMADDHPDVLESMRLLADILIGQGRFNQGVRLLTQELKMRKKVMGESHPHILSSMKNLAIAYSKQGQWGKKERITMEILELRKRMGHDEVHILSSLEDLENVYLQQGRKPRQASVLLQVLLIRRRVFGEEHPNTLSTMYRLAGSWWFLGRQDDAIAMMETCAMLQQRVFGLNHRDTKQSLDIVKSWRQEYE